MTSMTSILRDAMGNAIGHTEVISEAPANVVKATAQMPDDAKDFIYEMWATAF